MAFVPRIRVKDNGKFIDANIGLAFDFLESQIERRTINIHDQVNVVIIPSDDAEVATFNHELGDGLTQRGETVIFLSASKSTPDVGSYDRFSQIKDTPPPQKS